MCSKENPFTAVPHIQNSLRTLDNEIYRKTLFLNTKRQQIGSRGFNTKARTAERKELEVLKRRAEHIRIEFGFDPMYQDVRKKLKEARELSF